jgi:hypothetical protein
MQIIGYEGVGPIRFGMSREDVRSALGTEFKSFKRSPSSSQPCDHCLRHECFVYYDAKGLVEAVEFAEPATPTLDGVNLLGVSFASLVEKIRLADPHLSVESDGFTSLRLGIGGWAAAADEEPDEPLESIIVFSRGYYD